MTAPLVVTFEDVGADSGPLVGGKAASLGELLRAGAHVPEGLVVTTYASARFLALPALAEAARDVLERARAGDLDEGKLAALRERLGATPLPDDVRQALHAARRKLWADGALLAVRSSGTKEDLAGASFAGQYETVLGVVGDDALEAALKRCWASLWTPRVLGYAAERGGGLDGLAMGVAVQRLVAAEVAGVMFTVHPLTGREGETLVEAAFGLGEALVSGRTNADQFVVRPTDGHVLERKLADKSVRIEALVGGGTRELHLEGEARKAPTLDDAQLAALARAGADIQVHYGRPMDVEFAFSGGKLWILQARPITKLSFASDAGEWTTADFKDGGVSSDVCAPLMWSLYRMCVEHSMPRYFKDIKLLDPKDERRWMGYFFARPYWNFGGVKEVLEPIPGYVERNFDMDLGISPSYEGPGKTTPVTLGGVLKALPVLFALKRSYKEVLAADRRFCEAFDAKKAPYEKSDAELAALPFEGFLASYRSLLRGLYFETETQYFTTIYNTSNSKLDFKVHFERARKAAGELDYLALVGGLQDLSHMRPLADLQALCGRIAARGGGPTDDEVREFAQKWRHHGRKELDIRMPRWHEDLAFVRQTIEEGVASFDGAHDPTVAAKGQHAAYVREREKAERALRFRPFARGGFRKMLDLVRRYAWWREEMRDRSSYAYYLVRRWSLEAARRLCAEGKLEATDDLWYLELDDVLAFLEGKLAVGDAWRKIAAGRRTVQAFRHFKNPNEIGSQYKLTARAVVAGDGVLVGTGCSPGRVEGRARVISRLEDVHRVEKGDILVTPFTDPGWTPVFARIGGVVTETGGVLAHAAVISREYGLPAVLAVPGATERIPDGARVRIDGSAGTVELVKL